LCQRANPDYWIPKIARNMERDREQTQHLTRMGWVVLRFWETDILSDPQAVATRIKTRLDFARSASRASRP
jgi:DNA mismatch endonuclease (patch repair protein)